MKKFEELLPQEKLMFVGNVLVVIGISITSIGHLLSLMKSGELPKYSLSKWPPQDRRGHNCDNEYYY